MISYDTHVTGGHRSGWEVSYKYCDRGTRGVILRALSFSREKYVMICEFLMMNLISFKKLNLPLQTLRKSLRFKICLKTQFTLVNLKHFLRASRRKMRNPINLHL